MLCISDISQYPKKSVVSPCLQVLSLPKRVVFILLIQEICCPCVNYDMSDRSGNVMFWKSTLGYRFLPTGELNCGSALIICHLQYISIIS